MVTALAMDSPVTSRAIFCRLGQIMAIQDIELSAQDIRAQQEELARTVGLSVHDAYERMDAGAFRGSILESELHMLRFLLDEPELQNAAE